MNRISETAESVMGWCSMGRRGGIIILEILSNSSDLFVNLYYRQGSCALKMGTGSPKSLQYLPRLYDAIVLKQAAP
jgi:hypothetical protein